MNAQPGSDLTHRFAPDGPPRLYVEKPRFDRFGVGRFSVALAGLLALPLRGVSNAIAGGVSQVLRPMAAK